MLSGRCCIAEGHRLKVHKGSVARARKKQMNDHSDYLHHGPRHLQGFFSSAIDISAMYAVIQETIKHVPSIHCSEPVGLGRVSCFSVVGSMSLGAVKRSAVIDECSATRLEIQRFIKPAFLSCFSPLSLLSFSVPLLYQFKTSLSLQA